VSAIPYQSGSFDPVRPDEDTWSCYDYSINYARENPEWGVVTLSNNPCFYGQSHYVNWKVENDMLYLYDSQYNVKCGFEIDKLCMMECNEWFKPCYYKFWSVDETPHRNYRILQDNSMEWLNV
jgi:hypothetical protein